MSGVKYTGGATKRQITEANWIAAGINGQQGVVWAKGNGRTVALDRFTSEALDLLESSEGFRVEREAAADDKKPSKPAAPVKSGD